MSQLFQVNARSINPNISTGPIAQNDLKRDGYIGVTFYKSNKIIGVDVAGFSSQIHFTLFPKTEKEKMVNQYFIERYVDRCINPLTIKSLLKINS